MRTIPRLIIIACGNPSRGDDALGPETLRRLGEETAYRSDNCDWKGVTDFQLQIEHAQDLLHCDLALFIDASMTAPPPFSFLRLEPRRDTSYTSHAMRPAAVLHVYGQAYRTAPPPAFMLSIRGEDFALGHNMSTLALKNLRAATDFAKRLVSRPIAEHWTTQARIL